MEKVSKQQEYILFAGSSNPKLGKEVCEILTKKTNKKVELADIILREFNDGENWCQIKDSIRGKEVFLLQSTCKPVNNHLMEMFLITDALKRASAKSVNALIPYYGYARQDRKSRSRVPISAALVSRLIEAAGIDRVLAIDLHCGQIQGFFHNSVPVDNIYGRKVLLKCLLENVKDLEKNKVVAVSPDAGGVERTDSFRRSLNMCDGFECKMAVMNKYRDKPGSVGKMELIGQHVVKGSDCIIVDDMADTCGTLCKSAELLMENGAKRVFACITHGLFNGNAMEKIEKSVIAKLFVTNTIPEKEKTCSKVIYASVAETLAEAIIVIKQNSSMSELFPLKKEIKTKE